MNDFKGVTFLSLFALSTILLVPFINGMEDNSPRRDASENNENGKRHEPPNVKQKRAGLIRGCKRRRLARAQGMTVPPLRFDDQDNDLHRHRCLKMRRVMEVMGRDHGENYCSRLKFVETTCHELIFCVSEDCPEGFFDLIFREGARANMSNDQGIFPLHEAAQNERIENAQVLLDHGADINAKDRDGLTALDYALRSKKLSMVAWLLERGAIASEDISGIKGSIEEITARFALYFDVMQEGSNATIERTFLAQYSHAAVQTAFRVFAAHGALAFVQEFLLHSTDFLNHNVIQDAFLQAARNGHLAVVRYLASHAVFEYGIFGQALIAAAAQGHASVAHWLVEHLQLQLARQQESAREIQSIFSGALQRAARSGHKGMVVLLTPLIDDDSKARILSDVLKIAALSAHTEVVEYLLAWDLRNGCVLEIRALGEHLSELLAFKFDSSHDCVIQAEHRQIAMLLRCHGQARSALRWITRRQGALALDVPNNEMTGTIFLDHLGDVLPHILSFVAAPPFLPLN